MVTIYHNRYQKSTSTTATRPATSLGRPSRCNARVGRHRAVFFAMAAVGQMSLRRERQRSYQRAAWLYQSLGRLSAVSEHVDVLPRGGLRGGRRGRDPDTPVRPIDADAVQKSTLIAAKDRDFNVEAMDSGRTIDV